MASRYRVFTDIRPHPRPHEISAAELVADFLHAEVRFVPASKIKTPDLLIANQFWEIKSPVGSTTGTIRHQFECAEKQAKLMIFDARRVKMNSEECLRRTRFEFKKSKSIKRVIYIDRNNKIFEL